MLYNDFKFTSEDNQEIFVANWLPEKEVKLKGVVQISQGMAEHIGRYSHFASHLNKHGYIVYGNDHRGAGKTAGVLERIGFFADSNGFQLVVDDMKQLTTIIKEKHPGLPIFLFGHSMGSLLVRAYIAGPCETIKGAILSGTPKNPGVIAKVGMLIAKIQASIQGKRARSKVLDKLTFGGYNAAFKPNRTDFDWLSRDEREVDKYVEDPYCGNIYSAGFFVDLLHGIIHVFKAKSRKNTPDSLPLLLFAGEYDPVGGSKEVEKIGQSYRDSGSKDVSIIIYPGGRHEMLNEINREEVFSDVVNWLDDHLDNK